MMNPWAIVFALVAWGASVGGAFFYGQGVGKDSEVAAQARIGQAIIETREQAQQGAAEAISRIKVTNTTIHQEVQHEVRTERIYADCKLPAVGLRIANDALRGRPFPAGGGELPRADADGGRR
jgi:hypothetical protein